MSLLAGEKITIDADLPSGAIIFWTQDNNCPSGYTRITAYDDSYIAAGAAVSTNPATAHAHTGNSHSHTTTAVNTGAKTGDTATAGGISAVDVEKETYHPYSSTTSGSQTAAVDSAASPGLQKVDVLLCKKN